MNRIAFAVGVILFSSCGIFSRTPESITKVDRLCGYLVSETETERESIPKERISLYRRGSTTECCNVQDRLAEVQTKRDGKFQFKRIPAGPYWIVAVVEKREYKMAIDFVPSKDAQDCTWNLYTIDRGGQFILKTYVT